MASIQRKKVIQRLLSPFEQRSNQSSNKAFSKGTDTRPRENSIEEKSTSQHQNISRLSNELNKLKRDIAELIVSEINLIDGFLDHHEKLKQANLVVGRNNKNTLRPKSFAAIDFYRSTSTLSSGSFRIKSCYEPDFDIFHLSESESITRNTVKEKRFIREKFLSKSLREYVDEQNIENQFDYQTSSDEADSGTWEEVEPILSANEKENKPESKKKLKRGFNNERKQRKKSNKNFAGEMSSEKASGGQSVNTAGLGEIRHTKNLYTFNRHLSNEERADSSLFFGSEAFNIDDVITKSTEHGENPVVELKEPLKKEQARNKNQQCETTENGIFTSNGATQRHDTEIQQTTKHSTNDINPSSKQVEEETRNHEVRDYEHNHNANNDEKVPPWNQHTWSVIENKSVLIKKLNPKITSKKIGTEDVSTNPIQDSKKKSKSKSEDETLRSVEKNIHPSDSKQLIQSPEHVDKNLSLKTPTSSKTTEVSGKSSANETSDAEKKRNRYEIRRRNSSLRNKKTEPSRQTYSARRKSEDRLSVKERMEIYLRAVEKL